MAPLVIVATALGVTLGGVGQAVEHHDGVEERRLGDGHEGRRPLAVAETVLVIFLRTAHQEETKGGLCTHAQQGTGLCLPQKL